MAEEEFFSPDLQQLILLAFIRKTYSLVCIQLIFLEFITLLVSFSSPIQTYLESHYSLLIAAVTISGLVLLPLAFVPSIVRRVPINYMLFLVFSAGQAVLLAYVCVWVDPLTISVAVGMAGGAMAALLVYVCMQKKQFYFEGGLSVAVLYTAVCLTICVFIYIYASSFFWRCVLFTQIICTFFALTYAIYILLSTYSITIDHDDPVITLEEYVLGAIMLYAHMPLLLLLLLKNYFIALCIYAWHSSIADWVSYCC